MINRLFIEKTEKSGFMILNRFFVFLLKMKEVVVARLVALLVVRWTFCWLSDVFGILDHE